jgi:hypothetical protein
LDVALKKDGTLVAWGSPYLKPPPDLNDVIAVASSPSHYLVLRADGTVAAWGNNDSQQTNVPAGLSDVVSIAASRGLSMALKADGTVVAWGRLWHNGTTNTPAGMGNVVSISAGQTQLLRVIAYGVPYLTAEPWDQTVSSGSKARFVAKAVSSKPTTYQWQHDEVDIPGATSSVLEIANAQPKDTGSYSAVVSNELGSTSTRKAKLKVTVSSPPAFDAVSCHNHRLTFTIRSSAGAALQIERSSDAQEWTPVETVTNQTGSISLTYPAKSSAGFYRAKRL